jgi:hypothetical protein
LKWTAVDWVAFSAGAVLFYPREIGNAGLMILDPRFYPGVLSEMIITGVFYFIMAGPMAVAVPLNVGSQWAAFLPTSLKRLGLCSIAVGCFAWGLHYSNGTFRF